MIFVTVGTHEQQFDRLLRAVDQYVVGCAEDVVVQTGYSTYKPLYCQYEAFFSHEEINTLMRKANIIITHGGPSSFILPIQIGKTPIVVPRQKKYNEHINDHQLNFVSRFAEYYNSIIPIYEVDELEKTLTNYPAIIDEMKQKEPVYEDTFSARFEIAVNRLLNNQ